MDTNRYEVGSTVHIDPATLLTDRNIRDAKPDTGLVKSISAVGVLEPITAVITTEGTLRVRFGERRTHAATKAKQQTVPVYIVGLEHDQDDNAAEADRIIRQRDENTHRDGLSTSENIGVVEQLSLLGFSPAQIAKQARITRADVEDSLAVVESKIARKAADRYSDLTLDQAAALAEFDDDPETVKVLVAAAKTGQFEHVAQRARDQRTRDQLRAEVTEVLTKGGITVIDPPSYDAKAKQAVHLYPNSESEDRYDRAEEHADCPGAVAWVSTEHVTVDETTGDEPVYPDQPDSDADEAAWDAYEEEVAAIRRRSRTLSRPAAFHGCADPSRYGHQTWDQRAFGASGRPTVDQMTDEERETARAARQLVRENNLAWDSAESIRRDWVATFAKAKTAPKCASRFIAEAVALDSHLLSGVSRNALAAQWLGKSPSDFGHADLSPAKSAPEARCLMVALVQILACYEASLNRHTWRADGTDNAAGRYIRFLAKSGYTLSDVEQYALTSDTA